jgi:hypothetical protein
LCNCSGIWQPHSLSVLSSGGSVAEGSKVEPDIFVVVLLLGKPVPTFPEALQPARL